MLRRLSVECACVQKLLIILYIVLLHNVVVFRLVNRFIGKPVEIQARGCVFKRIDVSSCYVIASRYLIRGLSPWGRDNTVQQGTPQSLLNTLSVLHCMRGDGSTPHVRNSAHVALCNLSCAPIYEWKLHIEMALLYQIRISKVCTPETDRRGFSAAVDIRVEVCLTWVTQTSP